MAMLERSGQGEASAAGVARESDRATAATAATSAAMAVVDLLP